MTQSEGCPSRWALERYSLQKTAAESLAEPELQRHVESCKECQAHLFERQQVGERFMSSPEAQALRQRLAAARPPSARQAALASWAPVVALCTMGLVASASLMFPESDSVLPIVADGDLSAKGTAAFSLWVERDGQVSLLSTAARPGERLQPAFATPEPGYVALFAVTPELAVTELYPTAMGRAAAVPAQASAPLGSSFRLDDQDSTYTLWLCFSTQPFGTSEIAAALRRTGSPSCPGLTLRHTFQVSLE